MPDMFMISPAGYLALINHGASGPSLDVFRPLIGARGEVFRTTGVMTLSGLTGKQGTILASVVAGAAGSARAVAFLVDRWPSPTKWIGIALDATNRPYAVMSVGGLGVPSGQSIPSGTAIPSGGVINVRLAYNALNPIGGGLHAMLQVEDAVIGTWAVDPLVGWLPFIPTAIMVGESPAGGIAAMVGSVKHIQVSDQVEVAFRAVPATEEESVSSLIQAGSVMTAGAEMVYASTGSASADSTVAAETAMSLVGDAALSADSTVAADIDVTTP